ncbi:MAG: 4Fe-4S binding protein [Anaerolineae bacterium]|jgi:ferredoxin|nr:4Fe-4S binding protein [Anaerolineae bacterium]
MKRLSELFMRPATRAFMQEARRTPGFSWIDRLHGYIYARWTYLYISMGIGEHPVVRTLGPVREWIKQRFLSFVTSETPRQASATESTATFADGYHGKVLSLEAATQLVTINQEISLPNLEQVIPYVRARDLILENPDHIVVLDCPCRMAREHPCLPLDVCLIIGEPFASLVIEHHPNHARWITSGEAVEILRAEEGRGHLHHAFFKDAMLGRFYAICNCCTCCCGALQAQRNGTPMLASSGYVCQVMTEACVGCGRCEKLCPFDAIAVGEEPHVARVDPARCMGCGLCVTHCPKEALSLERDLEKAAPLEIHALMAATLEQG